jgi:rubrerythrin
MTEVFGAYQIAEMAVEVEEAGAQFYSGLAALAEDEKLKDFFLELSRQEIDHREIFGDIAKKARESKNPVVYSMDFYNYVRGMITDLKASAFDEQTEVLGSKDMVKAVERAIGVEAKSIQAYTKIYDTLDKRIVEVLPKIISEEKQHLKDLTDLKMSLKA